MPATTAGPFAKHPADPETVDELGDRLSRFGSRAESVGVDADRHGWLAGAVESRGLFDPIRSTVRPVLDSGVMLASASRVGRLSLTVWSRAVRDYNRTIDRLNAEWETAKAGNFGVGELVLDRSAMRPAQVDDALAEHTAAVGRARHALWADLVHRRHTAESRLDAVAEGVAGMLGNADDPDVQLLAATAFAPPQDTEEPSSSGSCDIMAVPEMVCVSSETYASGDGQSWSEIADDLGEAFAFVFADPRQCVGDDASASACAVEVAGIIPVLKAPKWGLRIAEYLRKSRKAEEAAKRTDEVPSPRSPMGHRGKEIEVPDGTNAPAVIGGRPYSGHALDRMQKRGFTPRVVEDAVRTNPRTSAGDGKYIHYDPENRISVIVNDDGRVITVIPRDVRP